MLADIATGLAVIGCSLLAAFGLVAWLFRSSGNAGDET